MDPLSSSLDISPTKPEKKPKSATFQLQDDLQVQDEPLNIDADVGVVELFEVNIDPDAKIEPEDPVNDTADAVALAADRDDEDDEDDDDVNLRVPVQLPTRLRPGTPAASRSNSPHVKQKIKQMSMSEVEGDSGQDKQLTGSKSAPVPRQSKGHGHHHHHHHSAAAPKTVALSEALVAAAGLATVSNEATPSSTTKHQHRHHHHGHGHSHGHEVVLAAIKGSCFIPTRTRPRPESNSFIETNDLGPPGADRRWLIDMKGFRDDEVNLKLDGVNLKIEGRQNSRPGKPTHHSETIILPITYDIENLKVYRNNVLGTLILSYLPKTPT